MLQEARFDRHFVRDLTWSRHQLEELAKRRFIAAQKQRGPQALVGEGYVAADSDLAKGSFNDLFKKVRLCVLHRLWWSPAFDTVSLRQD